MDIQLVIRAPNQNIEDQVINCSDDWTILKLKTHLAEVYPNKPVIQEQKLIYSGHLLPDHLHLKDVVRSGDKESNTHIFHLVYNGKYPSSQNQNLTSSQSVPNQNLFSHAAGLFYPSAETSTTSTLRHRTQAFLPQTNNSQMPVGAFPPIYNDPQVIAQVAAMQQMYTQYLTQYWESINGGAMSGNASVLPVMPSVQSPQNTSNARAPPNQQANQRINIMNGNAEENDFINRDWLDGIFQFGRFFILLSFVYFYSTPERFILVVLCVVVVIMHREGWFFRQTFDAVMRRRNWYDAEGNAPPNNVNERPQVNEGELQEGQEIEAAMDGENPPHAQNPDVINNNQGFSAFSIIAAFFFSLVPEPPPPVNIN